MTERPKCAFSAVAALVLLSSLCLIGSGQEKVGTDMAVSNEFLALTFKLVQGVLRPQRLVNRVTGESLELGQSDGFVLYLGEPDPLMPKDALRLADFTLTRWMRQEQSVIFDLEDRTRGIGCRGWGA